MEYIHTQKTIYFFLVYLEDNYKDRIMPGPEKKKKAKGAKNIDKLKRKVAQFKNRKTEKSYERTHNTNLQDKPRSGNSGVYSKGGIIQHD